MDDLMATLRKLDEIIQDGFHKPRRTPKTTDQEHVRHLVEAHLEGEEDPALMATIDAVTVTVQPPVNDREAGVGIAVDLVKLLRGRP